MKKFAMPILLMVVLSGTARSSAAGPTKHVKGDYDGDGRTDAATWNTSNFKWTIHYSSGIASTATAWGQPNDIPVFGDFDGDGKTDPTVWRPDNGTWYVLSSKSGGSSVEAFGVFGDIPVTGDFDGDGIADVAVWRPSNGTWYILNSSGAPRNDVAFGVNGDIPVAGDYDGDGIADRAVWRPSNGTWYVLSSKSGGTSSEAWGVLGDIPVPGDYDGDGIVDLAVWRPSNGTWYVLNSSGAARNDVAWGVLGDVPLPGGDYDGDGKSDRAVWRTSNTTLYIIKSSTGGSTSSTIGSARDLPMPDHPAYFMDVPTKNTAVYSLNPGVQLFPRVTATTANCDWYSPFDNTTFPASVDFTQHSGIVLPRTFVILDFWGSYYANAANQTQLKTDAQNVFGVNLGLSRFWNKTAEYGATQGMYAGFVSALSSAPSCGSSSCTNLTQSQVETQIRADIRNNSGISPTASIALVVILPSNLSYDNGGGSLECRGCGHHTSFVNPDSGGRVNYATVSTSGDELQDMYVVSHEVGEIATDPDTTQGGQGYYAPPVPGSKDKNNLENGDACQNIRDTINGSPTAMLWSQAACGCY